MQRTLLALSLALPLLATPALALPPTAGATHDFVDPVFTGTVFCDTFEEVHAIATAAEPVAMFQAYSATLNDKHEPTCAAIMATATVVDVRPLGVMERDNKRFNAWAIETKVNDQTGFALYLEARADIIV
jgi:hypothetical protein